MSVEIQLVGKENTAPSATNMDQSGGSKDTSLQDAFKAFQTKRKEIQKRNRRITAQNKAKAKDRPQEVKDELRQKFVEQALKYLGIPYSRKYHQDPSSPHHNAPLYLDCCGLVRRVLRDLKQDFGFEIGPYHQSYQMDCLPIELKEEEMRPGDLVFTEAPLYDTTKKCKEHNITHVEIWLGDGRKVLGSRWGKRGVEIHDTYEFVSEKYGPNKYHFRSIDTWLRGICKSHCRVHTWPVKIKPTAKSSIFAISDDEDEEGEAGDSGDESK